MHPNDFEFDSLKHLKEITALAYMVGAVSRLNEDLKNPRVMSRLMSTAYEAEDAAVSPGDLNIMKQHWPGDYHPLAPVSLCLRWSPIAWLLRVLPFTEFVTKDEGKGIAIGVWRLDEIQALELDQPTNTPDPHFLDILREAHGLGRQQDLLLHIVAKPGWSYEYTKENPLAISTKTKFAKPACSFGGDADNE